MNPSRLLSNPLFTPFALQTLLAYEWLFSGGKKALEGQFVSGIAKTLVRFESSNPHAWYANSVLVVAKGSPVVFGTLVQWGEILTGIGLFVALALYIFSNKSSFKSIARFIAITALFGGAFMNLNFYFAAGWTSPSTAGLNVLMFWTSVILIGVWVGTLQESQHIRPS